MAGWDSLLSKSSAAEGLWEKPPHSMHEEHTESYLQADISTIF